MENVCFLVQIKHTANVYEKGVVVKTADTLDHAIEAAKQSFHAYFGAYGYGHDTNTDFVMCMICLDDGRIVMNEVDDRRPREDVD
mgnify:CR=1 FL=1